MSHFTIHIKFLQTICLSKCHMSLQYVRSTISFLKGQMLFLETGLKEFFYNPIYKKFRDLLGILSLHFKLTDQMLGNKQNNYVAGN